MRVVTMGEMMIRFMQAVPLIKTVMVSLCLKVPVF